MNTIDLPKIGSLDMDRVVLVSDIQERATGLEFSEHGRFYYNIHIDGMPKPLTIYSAPVLTDRTITKRTKLIDEAGATAASAVSMTKDTKTLADDIVARAEARQMIEKHRGYFMEIWRKPVRYLTDHRFAYMAECSAMVSEH